MGFCSNIGHGLFVGWVEHPTALLGFDPQSNVGVSHFCGISETQQNGRE
jgi:hypothetical protein